MTMFKCDYCKEVVDDRLDGFGSFEGDTSWFCQECFDEIKSNQTLNALRKLLNLINS